MAITVPTTWALVPREETQADEPIAIGNNDEIGSINEQTSRNFAASTGVQRAVYTCTRAKGGTSIVGTPNLTASYNVIARGKIRVWGEGARFKYRVYGRYLNAYASVGGVAFSAITLGATPGWLGLGTAAAITGATIDADGFAEVIFYARYTNASLYQLQHFVLSEVELTSAQMPDGATPTEQGYYPYHDEAYAADMPLDCFLLQGFDDQAGRARIERARGLLHLNSLAYTHNCSSVHWRLDGPYVIVAPPWAERATVVVTALLLSASYGNVQVCVVSEHERLFDVIEDRYQTLSSASATHLKFDDVKIRPDGAVATPQLVWVAFRSELGSDIADVQIGAHPKPWKLYCDDTITARIPDAHWYTAGYLGMDSASFSAKQDFDASSPSSYFDIANIVGEETVVTSAGDPVRQPIIISPHPDTGLTQEPASEEVYSYAAVNPIYTPTMDVWTKGAMIIQGVYVEALGPALERRKLAFPGGLPSAGLVGEIIDRVNEMTVWLTPQLLTRHHGARNLIDDTSGTNRVFHDGNWFFVPSASGTAVARPIEIPLPYDPNHGETTGLISQKVYAQIFYIMCIRESQAQAHTGRFSLYFAGEDEVEHNVPLDPHAGGSPVASPTVADASLAASLDGASEDPASSAPVETTEGSYSCQYTWPTEGFRDGMVWRKSEVVEVDMPASFPTILTLNIKNYGGPSNLLFTTKTSLIVAGLAVWCGPRIPA